MNSKRTKTRNQGKFALNRRKIILSRTLEKSIDKIQPKKSPSDYKLPKKITMPLEKLIDLSKSFDRIPPAKKTKVGNRKFKVYSLRSCFSEEERKETIHNSKTPAIKMVDRSHYKLTPSNYLDSQKRFQKMLKNKIINRYKDCQGAVKKDRRGKITKITAKILPDIYTSRISISKYKYDPSNYQTKP
ncbi:unnamed protein product [Moneuplotes crassus]|uniref:Uncharacterized protein n=1 Tax=Euplotes crassus TaxID=5936 RepID=A0AAD1UM83_EUPCR|nr:unnamed protein product [Moneuplotes crassus]